MNIEEEYFYKFLGGKVSTFRKRFGITQEKLGEFLNLSRVSIVNIEKGTQKLSLYQCYRISEYFNLPIDAFFSEFQRNTGFPNLENIKGRDVNEKTLLDLNSFLSKIKE